jgi:hypothetical protein
MALPFAAPSRRPGPGSAPGAPPSSEVGGVPGVRGRSRGGLRRCWAGLAASRNSMRFAPAIECHEPPEEAAMARRGRSPALGVLIASCLAARMTAAEYERPPHVEADTGSALIHETVIRPDPALLMGKAGSFTVDAVSVAADLDPPGPQSPQGSSASSVLSSRPRSSRQRLSSPWLRACE